MMDVALCVRSVSCLRGEKVNRVNIVRLCRALRFRRVPRSVHRQRCWPRILIPPVWYKVIQDRLGLTYP